MSCSEITIEIAGRKIGPSYPPYVIAEVSGNHNGDINRAKELLEAAKDAGVDAVKMQTYTADTITIDHRGEGFEITQGLWKGRTLYELYDEAHTPWEWHAELFERARKLQLTIFSSPFDTSAVDFLESLNVPAYKIASFELVDIPLVKAIATTGKPLIMSTGMAGITEISEAVEAATSAGCERMALLHCVSGYPTPPLDANVKTVADLALRFGVVAGISDHTIGIGVSVAAVALGASIVEKHFTLKRSDGGPDAAFSLEPNELKTLVNECRSAWESLGDVNYSVKPSEQQNLQFRRSLYVVADVRKGESFTPENVRSIRPGYGLSPKQLPEVLNRKASCNIACGTPLSIDMIEDAG